MKIQTGLFLAFFLVGVSLGDPYDYASSFGYVVPQQADPANTQQHGQDGLGQYHYGYSSPTSQKSEVKTADGVVRGSYQYIDANNLIQTVNYVSDSLGFRVAATNLPQGPSVPEQVVQPAPAPYVAPAPVVVAQAAPTTYVATAPVAPQVTPAHHPYYAYAPNYHYLPYLTGQAPTSQTPVAVAAPTPVAAPVPVNIVQAPVITKYHSQDEFGQYAFGYNDGLANRDEIRDANGAVKGSYNYVDINGVPQSVQYIADHNGFQVQGTTVQIDNGQAPLPVEDTPEVAAAKAAHLKIYSEIKNSMPDYEVAPVTIDEVDVPVVAVAAEPEPYVAEKTNVEYDTDDMEVIAAEPETVAKTVPYAATPVHYYAPAQGYYQAPVAPQVVQAPAPVAYYAPYHGYQPALAPHTVPATYQGPDLIAAPAPAAVAPVAVPTPEHSQFHAQDGLGGYNYGYATAESSKQEFRTPDGIIQGTYSYVDANGILQTVNYVSDAEGFKVAATNLPKAPIA